MGSEAQDKLFSVWQSGLTGRFYAGWAKRRKGTTVEQDLWEFGSGAKHDVTDAVEAYIHQRVNAVASAAETVVRAWDSDPTPLDEVGEAVDRLREALED